MAVVNMHLTIGNVKNGVLSYTPEISFTVAPRSLVGPHFPYINMALKGGNSTGATSWISLFLPDTKNGQCIGLH